MAAIRIEADFDSGNIEPLAADDPREIGLAIRPDPGSGALQWFHFRLRGAQGRPVGFAIRNAGRASFPQGWPGCRVCVSADGTDWRRLPTRYADGILRFADRPAADGTAYALFAPYAADRLEALLARCRRSPGIAVESVGRSVEGRPLPLIALGSGRPRLWIVARQHPGETPAAWWTEGLVERLLEDGDATAARLRERATLHIAPNLNPDGSRRGHFRGNALGVDLNRQWAAPDPARAPEVAALLARMEATGVDLCIDLHADAVLPYVYIDPAEDAVGAGRTQRRRRERFEAALCRASPDFQTERRYPYAEPPDAAALLALCAPQITRRFGATAFTLELPFSDYDRRPDPARGWSPARSRALGAAAVEALLAAIEAPV